MRADATLCLFGPLANGHRQMDAVYCKVGLPRGFLPSIYLDQGIEVQISHLVRDWDAKSRPWAVGQNPRGAHGKRPSPKRPDWPALFSSPTYRRSWIIGGRPMSDAYKSPLRRGWRRPRAPAKKGDRGQGGREKNRVSNPRVRLTARTQLSLLSTCPPTAATAAAAADDRVFFFSLYRQHRRARSFP